MNEQEDIYSTAVVSALAVALANVKVFMFSCDGQGGIRAGGYKTFFMLNSTEHKNLIAHVYENIKKFSIFQAQIGLECYFSRS